MGGDQAGKALKRSRIMRRNIVWEGADQLHYEIREIVGIAGQLEKLGAEIIYENIGDPIQKGEAVPDWIRQIVIDLVSDSSSYGYTRHRR